MSIAISIVSHNRAEELERTLKAIQLLKPSADELWIALDGCTDNSRSVVKTLAPDAIVLKTDQLGSIPNRHRILTESQCDYVLSLDDDSYPMEHNALEIITEILDTDSDIGILTFPQISDEFPDQHNNSSDQSFLVGSFANSGAVIRTSSYRTTSGYPVFFGHAYEEPDLCLQMIHKGQKSVMTHRLNIRHHYSTIERNERRTHCFHARNEFLSTILRAPMGHLPFALLRTILSQGRYALKRGWLYTEFQWWLSAIKRIPTAMSQRSAVRSSAYRQWRMRLHEPKEYIHGSKD